MTETDAWKVDMSSYLRSILILTVALAWMVIAPAWVSSFGMCVSCGSNYPAYPMGDESLWRAEAYYFMYDNCDNYNSACGAINIAPVLNQTKVNAAPSENATMPMPENIANITNVTMPQNKSA